MDVPWAPVAATGIGSLPFDDRDEAARIVTGELPDFPHLPELPGRGPGSAMAGRTAAILADLHADLQPSGWRLIDRPGADIRRARAELRADLDAFEVAAYGYAGPLKVQAAGPLTLAATLQLTRGDRAVADHGARRDLAASLAEGVAAHVGDVARRVPGASVVVQLDEPSLPAVLAARIPTVSGFGRLRAVRPEEAEALIAAVVDAVTVPVVAHCCAPGVPAGLLRRAGAVAVAVDVESLDDESTDDLAEAVDAGLGLWAGVVPTSEPAARPDDRQIAGRAAALWRRLDQDPLRAASRTVLTPACGLAGADPAWARRAYTLTRSAARAYADIVGLEQ